MVIYKKKNTQALVEMDTVDNAESFRNDYINSINTKGFRIKVQYTTKKFLIVNKNSTSEYDIRKKQSQQSNSSNRNFIFLIKHRQ